MTDPTLQHNANKVLLSTRKQVKSFLKREGEEAGKKIRKKVTKYVKSKLVYADERQQNLIIDMVIQRFEEVRKINVENTNEGIKHRAEERNRNSKDDKTKIAQLEADILGRAETI
jgi:hypothetical protein